MDILALEYRALFGSKKHCPFWSKLTGKWGTTRFLPRAICQSNQQTPIRSTHSKKLSARKSSIVICIPFRKVGSTWLLLHLFLSIASRRKFRWPQQKKREKERRSTMLPFRTLSNHFATSVVGRSTLENTSPCC